MVNRSTFEKTYFLSLVSQALYSVCLLAIFLSPITALAEIQFSSRVEPTSGSVDDEYTFSLTIKGAASEVYPELTGGDDFKLTLIGPQKSITITNGEVDQTLTYVYRLVPIKSGNLETPAAELEVNGQKFSTPAIPVLVKGNIGATPKTSAEIFLRQSVQQDTVYRGEQIVNTIDLFSKVSILQASFEDLDFPDFLHYDIGKQVAVKHYIRGVRYNKNRLRKALFPLSSGRFTLPRRTLSGQSRGARKRGASIFNHSNPFQSDFFDSFLTGRARPFRVHSNALTVTVKDLPSPPVEFPTNNLASPIVGKLTAKIQVDKSPMKAGEGRTVEIEILSSGNLAPLKSIALPKEEGLKIYHETPAEQSFEREGKLFTRKTLRFSVVPAYGGSFTLPALKLGYFDPEIGKYRVASTEPIVLEVSGQPAPAREPRLDSGQSHPVDQLTERTPPPPAQAVPQYQDETTLERLSRQVSLPLAIMTLSIVVLLLGLATLTLVALRRPRPIREARTALQESGSAAEVRNSFLHYASLQLFKETGQPSREKVRKSVIKRRDGADLVFAIDTLLDDLDELLFSGIQGDAERFSTLKERALTLAGKLDSTLPGEISRAGLSQHAGLYIDGSKPNWRGEHA